MKKHRNEPNSLYSPKNKFLTLSKKKDRWEFSIGEKKIWVSLHFWILKKSKSDKFYMYLNENTWVGAKLENINGIDCLVPNNKFSTTFADVTPGDEGTSSVKKVEGNYESIISYKDGNRSGKIICHQGKIKISFKRDGILSFEDKKTLIYIVNSKGVSSLSEKDTPLEEEKEEEVTK